MIVEASEGEIFSVATETQQSRYKLNVMFMDFRHIYPENTKKNTIINISCLKLATETQKTQEKNTVTIFPQFGVTLCFCGKKNEM